MAANEDSVEQTKPLLADTSFPSISPSTQQLVEHDVSLVQCLRRRAVFEAVKLSCLGVMYYTLTRLLPTSYVDMVSGACNGLALVCSLLWIYSGDHGGEPQRMAMFAAYIPPVQMLFASKLPPTVRIPALPVICAFPNTWTQYAAGDDPACGNCSDRSSWCQALGLAGMIILAGTWICTADLVGEWKDVGHPLAYYLCTIASTYMMDYAGKEFKASSGMMLPGRVIATTYDICRQYLSGSEPLKHGADIWQLAARRYGEQWSSKVGTSVHLAVTALSMSLVSACAEFAAEEVKRLLPTLPNPPPGWVGSLLAFVVCGSFGVALGAVRGVLPLGTPTRRFLATSASCLNLGSLLGGCSFAMSVFIEAVSSSVSSPTIDIRARLLAMLILASSLFLLLVGCFWSVYQALPESMETIVIYIVWMVVGAGHFLHVALQYGTQYTLQDNQYWLYTTLAGAATVRFMHKARHWNQLYASRAPSA